MPNNADFSKLETINTVEINPTGWITPITIEYGISNDAMPLYYWRVKGTKHTFTIPVIRLDFISSGNYSAHFKEILEKFREDYLEWKQNNWNTEWMQEYKKQYEKFIVV
jgi:hypothetical protein